MFLSKASNFIKSDVGKKSVLVFLWFLTMILTFSLPIYETTVMLRGGYENVHIQASAGRSFFRIFNEGYESQFLYDTASALYLFPLIIVFIIALIIYTPQFFKSKKSIEKALANNPEKAKKALKSYKKASLHWFCGVFLIIALSSPEIACLVSLIQTPNSLFLSTYETTFSLVSSIIIRIILIFTNVLIYLLSRKITSKTYTEVESMLLAQDNETTAESEDKKTE